MQFSLDDPKVRTFIEICDNTNTLEQIDRYFSPKKLMLARFE